MSQLSVESYRGFEIQVWREPVSCGFRVRVMPSGAKAWSRSAPGTERLTGELFRGRGARGAAVVAGKLTVDALHHAFAEGRDPC